MRVADPYVAVAVRNCRRAHLDNHSPREAQRSASRKRVVHRVDPVVHRAEAHRVDPVVHRAEAHRVDPVVHRAEANRVDPVVHRAEAQRGFNLHG